MHEFEIIKTYFATQDDPRTDVKIGIGDDAAVVKVPQGNVLAITTDTLVAGIHFPESASAYDIGYKALAVNLSDLAAMGATPAWITLALTLPTADEIWLQDFCNGMFQLANRFQIQLIGGDLTRGPLSITLQAMGFLPEQSMLLRSKAKVGDLIYVTGTLGDAGLALKALQNKISIPKQFEPLLFERLHRPQPQVGVGEHLRQLANACIDISDGLAADLNHILEESTVGALLDVTQIPLSEMVRESLPPEEAIRLALTAGDDYELCFTIPASRSQELEKSLAHLPCRYTCIGKITAQKGLSLIDQHGNPYHDTLQGYEHF